MIDPNAELSVRRQCELVSACRSSLHYESKADESEDLALMRRMDELHLKWPFYGSRRLSQALKAEGHEGVNRKRIQRLMAVMGIEGMAPGPNTSRKAPEHAVYPYLLRKLQICRANQVWAADITYIPMAVGFVYLVAIMDWFSRRVLSWRLSNTLDARFCVEALQQALCGYGKPDIFNTDQGAQFTAAEFLDVLKEHGVKISMDGKGRWVDNVFVERLWRSLKYEEVYLHAYEDVPEAWSGICRYVDFYNFDRPHSSLGYQTPDAFYLGSINSAA